MADALERLPKHHREVIVLRLFKNLSFAEIALRMQRTDDSVQKLWVRGLAELKPIGGRDLTNPFGLRRPDAAFFLFASQKKKAASGRRIQKQTKWVW